MKEENFSNRRKPSHRQDCEEFWNLRGQQNPEEKKEKNPQNKCLTTTPSKVVAQKLASTTSEWGLDREV